MTDGHKGTAVSPARSLPCRDKPDAAKTIEISLDRVRQTLEGIRFGTIGLTVHEGRVVQIDITEKVRL